MTDRAQDPLRREERHDICVLTRHGMYPELSGHDIIAEDDRAMAHYPLFLRIGGHTFNPRHIVRIHDAPDTVTVHLTPTSDRADLIKLHGDDANAFRNWVEANVGDVTKPDTWGPSTTPPNVRPIR